MGSHAPPAEPPPGTCPPKPDVKHRSAKCQIAFINDTLAECPRCNAGVFGWATWLLVNGAGLDRPTPTRLAEARTDGSTVCHYTTGTTQRELPSDGCVAMTTSDQASSELFRRCDSGVAVAALNRPERMNTRGGELAGAFDQSVDCAEADPDVRVVVLAGSPVTQLRRPIIAAINAACAGTGLAQVLICDVRFAAASTKFTTASARRGLMAEYGLSWILPRVIGWNSALALLLSGRTFHAEEAVETRIGHEGRCARRADAAGAGLCRGHHRQLCERRRGGAPARIDGRPDFIEGITAFLRKRSPNFHL